jgi:hypothetical protein
MKDVDLLEREIILHENENNPERKLFLLGKEKLLEKMSEIEKKETEKENLKEEFLIHPDETISYAFEIKAPLLLRAVTYSLSFRISVEPHYPVNMLKRSSEGDLVAVWAESDQATGVCVVALAVVSEAWDLLRLSFEIVLAA